MNGPRDLGAAVTRGFDRAQPALLRLTATPKELAAWWQWRTRSGMPAWVGPRMGLRSGHGHPANTWCFRGATSSSGVLACTLPTRRAAVLCIGSERAITKAVSAFASDLLGPPTEPHEETLEEEQLDSSLWDEWRGKAWRTAASAPDACRLSVADDLEPRLEWRGKTWASVDKVKVAGWIRVSLRAGGNAGLVVQLFLPKPDRKRAQRFPVVLIETHGTVASLPHRFDLELEEK